MDKQEKALIELKKIFTKELVLAIPDLDKKIRIEVNTSDYTIEGVLSMEYEDRKWRPIAYLSIRHRETIGKADKLSRRLD